MYPTYHTSHNPLHMPSWTCRNPVIVFCGVDLSEQLWSARAAVNNRASSGQLFVHCELYCNIGELVDCGEIVLPGVYNIFQGCGKRSLYLASEAFLRSWWRTVS